jgi:hypothetical protein
MYQTNAEQRAHRATRTELLEAMVEVERLQAQLSMCMVVKHQLRTGEID